jgi:hypothetical protein
MAHPDEVVKEVQDVEDVPSQLVAEAQLRHEQAKSDLATDQEKKQAAVEEAHALSTRPDGSYAQLHETEPPTLAVADEGYKETVKEDVEAAERSVKGEAGSPLEQKKGVDIHASPAEPARASAEPSSKESPAKASK